MKGNPKIIEYSQLIMYEDFYQLLPKEKDYVIVLTEFKTKSLLVSSTFDTIMAKCLRQSFQSNFDKF